jgi:hypothetical protein
MDAITTLRVTCACIVVFACLSFLIYVLVQTIRKRALFKFMSLRLLVYIQISEMFAAVSDLYAIKLYKDEQHITPLCLFQAYQTVLFETSGLLWTLCFSIFMFLVVVFNVRKKLLLEIIFHISVWPLSILIASLPFTTNSYGHVGTMCWISPSEENRAGYLWEWLVSYGPAYIIMPIVLVLFFVIVGFVAKRNYQKNNANRWNAVYSKFMAYPIVFLLGWIFPSILRMYELATNDRNSFLYYTFLIFEVLCNRSQGLLNVIVYIIAPIDTSNSITLKSCKCLCCATESEEKNSLVTQQKEVGFESVVEESYDQGS